MPKEVDGAKVKSGLKKWRKSVYWPPEKEYLWERMEELCRTFPRISCSGILVTITECCIDTLEHDIPRKRVFEVNGKKVTL